MVTLEKGAKTDLFAKTAQPNGSRRFYIGAAWDGDVDLDLMALPLRANATATPEDLCFFNALEKFGGALKLSGDARDGAAAGDDESLVVNADGLPAEIVAIAVGVACYSADDMSAAKNTRLAVRDGDSAAAPELYALPMGSDDLAGETVLIACLLKREGDGFVLKNVGTHHAGHGKGPGAVSGFIAEAVKAAQA